MDSFRATIALLGINPYVSVPARHLAALFQAAGRKTSPIPIRVDIGGQNFRQNLVIYRGAWRLYLNAPMRAAAGKDVGERVTLGIAFDPAPRLEPLPIELDRALDAEPQARIAFAALTPSRRKEISRYLSSAKTDVTRTRNVAKVIAYLLGNEPPGLVVLQERTKNKPARRGKAPARS